MAVTEKLRFLLEADASGVVKAFDRVGDAADKNLVRAQSRMDKVSGGLTKFGAGAVASGALIGAGLFKAAKAFEDTAIEAGKFADATGVTVESASRLIEVASDLSIESGALESGLNKLNKTISASPEKLAAFGVAIQRAGDGTVDVEATFLSLIDRLNDIPDPARRAQVASELLGKGWQSMAELIVGGSDALRASMAEVSDAQVITDAELAKAKEFKASMDALSDSAKGLMISIGQGAAPVIGALAEAVGGAVSGFAGLNAVSGGAVGKVASIGATALVAGGSFAFLSGKAMQARAAITGMSTATKVGAGVIAGAAVVYSLYAEQQAAATARKQEFIAALKAEAAGQKGALAATAAAEVAGQGYADLAATLGIEVSDLARYIMGEYVPALDEATGALDDLDMFSQGVVAALELQRRALEKARGETERAAETTQDLADATDAARLQTADFDAMLQHATESERRANKVREEANKKIAEQRRLVEEAEQAFIDWNATVLGQANAQLALEAAIDSGEDALADYAAAQKKGNPEEISDALRDVKGDYLAIGEAAGRAAAEGLGPAATEMEQADAANKAMVASLTWLAGSLAPGSELRVYLEQYIAQLGAIPTSVTTSVGIRGPSEVFVSGASGATSTGTYTPSKNQRGAPTKRGVGAEGAVVTQATMALIGEAGPEAVVPLNRMPGASPLPAGGGGGITHNLYLTVQQLVPDRTSIQQLAGLLYKYGYLPR